MEKKSGATKWRKENGKWIREEETISQPVCRDSIYHLASHQIQQRNQAMRKISKPGPGNLLKKGKPEATDCRPLTESKLTFIVFVNPKSGGQVGPQLLIKFRELFKEVSWIWKGKKNVFLFWVIYCLFWGGFVKI